MKQELKLTKSLVEEKMPKTSSYLKHQQYLLKKDLI